MNSSIDKVTISTSPNRPESAGRSGLQLPFDLPAATEFVSARLQFLDRFLLLWSEKPFQTVLDAGTGVGYFAQHLSRNHKFQIVGLDARNSNIEEARKRNPDIEFRVGDVESSEFANHGQFDLVLALGLIYHLENPFRAIRNLVSASRDAIVVESLVAPGRGSKGWLLDEFQGDDQAVAYIAWHLSESSLVKIMYRAGVQNVYRAQFKPLHREFRGSLFRRPTRVFLIGTRTPLHSTDYKLVPEPFLFLDRSYYLRWPFRSVVERLLEWRREAKRSAG